MKGRAADYYDFMLGNGGDAKYSSFLSPAYRDSFEPDVLANLDHAMRRGNVTGSRLPKVEAGDVLVVKEGNFALTAIDPGAGDHYQGVSEASFVKVGTRWYVFVGSESEIAAYGSFPESLRTAMQELLAEAGGDGYEPDPKPELQVPEPEQTPEAEGDEGAEEAEAAGGDEGP